MHRIFYITFLMLLALVGSHFYFLIWMALWWMSLYTLWCSFILFLWHARSRNIRFQSEWWYLKLLLYKTKLLLGSTWVTQSDEPTLGFGSGHDLMGHEINPHVIPTLDTVLSGESVWRFSSSASPPTHVHTLSLS